MVYSRKRVSQRKKSQKKLKIRTRKKHSKKGKRYVKKGGNKHDYVDENEDEFTIRRAEDLTGEADEIQVVDFSTISNGANGIVYKITLEYNNRSVSESKYKKKKTDIVSDAREFVLKIPKTSKNQITDNIMFEYIAGMYINKLLSSFTSFIKTERLFVLDIDEDQGESTTQTKNQIQKTANNLNLKLYDEKNRPIKLQSIENLLVPIPAEIDQSLSLDLLDFSSSESAFMSMASCQLKDKYALLLQYFGGNTLQKTFLDNKQEIPPDVLFQMYAPLYAIGSDNLRHLDLHSGNILVRKLPVPITFVYYFDDPEIVYSGIDAQGNYEETPAEKVSIRTQYLVKIVDYGRAYTGNTEKFLNSYKQLSPEEKQNYENNMQQCGLIHVLKNQYNTSDGVDLQYIVEYPNYLWALNTQLSSTHLNESPTNFQIHIDCKKYSQEHERPSKYYTGDIPDEIQNEMELFGIVSPEKTF